MSARHRAGPGTEPQATPEPEWRPAAAVTGRPGRRRRRPRDVEELCEQFVPVCESAVDPLEICRALEFEGWSDKAVRDRYGVPDVFALAEQMYLRVPRRPAEPEPVAGSVAGQPRLRPALHGLLYGLPTVCFPAAAGLLTGPGVLSAADRRVAGLLGD